MRRYWIAPEDINSSSVFIKDEAFHHIFGVCRQELGSEFEVLGSPDSMALLVRVTKVAKKSAEAEIISKRLIPPLPSPLLVLNLSIPRLPVLESVVEKAVEMGVDRIQLFTSKHSFLKKPQDLSPARLERLQKIVLSATQQSGRSSLMPILPPLVFNEALAKWINQAPHSAGLIAYENSQVLGLKNQLQGLNLKSASEVWMFIGSEGGFDPAEVQIAQDKGLVCVGLGQQVLRVETACLALISSLKYDLGLM